MVKFQRKVRFSELKQRELPQLELTGRAVASLQSEYAFNALERE
jgi:hypothetical protein